jgi:[ribosomal protein S18]-alanine N-acetyltransferase
MMGPDPKIRQVTDADISDLSFLINNSEYLYRHLDWRTALDWVGSVPFLALERQHRLLAALACPRTQSPVGWIRVFAFLNWNHPQLRECWEVLFQNLCQILQPTQDNLIAGLGLQPWFSELLIQSGFYHRQDIVVLQWNGEMPEPRPFPAEISIRPMTAQDLPQVLVIDNTAFDFLWQHTRDELERAFSQAAYATVAEYDGEIVAYQISTGSPYHAHLARLAVDPGLQRMSLGYNIVRDLLVHFTERDISTITVNTQSDNSHSLALYQKIHFSRTGENFPVYLYPLA